MQQCIPYIYCRKKEEKYDEVFTKNVYYKLLVSFFVISLITFFVLNIVPGNPVEIMLGEFADQATIARVTHEMGLDQPIYIQYFSWLGNMLQGNFGTSYFQNKPVIDILTSSFLVTAKLCWYCLYISCCFRNSSRCCGCR